MAVLTMENDIDNESMKYSTCSCPKFKKIFTCKHIIGYAAAQKEIQFPATAKNVPIGVRIKDHQNLKRH
jgi:hypothetical protein